MARTGSFRSDFLRDLVKAAVRQGFGVDRSGNHPSLVCPVCGHREVITSTGKQAFHESRNKATRLRRHGLIWKGRGGQHA